jgi:hypothetical protein
MSGHSRASPYTARSLHLTFRGINTYEMLWTKFTFKTVILLEISGDCVSAPHGGFADPRHQVQTLQFLDNECEQLVDSELSRIMVNCGKTDRNMLDSLLLTAS